MFGCQERRSKNKLVQMERDRIKKDYERADRIEELDSIRGAMQRAEFEGATQAGSALRFRELTLQKETELAKTALILVRRAALQGLLEQERQLYHTELIRQGKAIYTQRI